MNAPGAMERRGLPVALRGVVHLYPSVEGDVVALRGVDLDVPAGTSVTLLGPSGAGKSTVLGLLAGAFAPSSGQVVVGGHDVGRMTAARLARLRAIEVSLVVQGAARNLLPYATVADNVWFAQRGAGAHGRRPPLGVAEILEAFDATELAGWPAGSLPPGQQQLAAVIAGTAPLPGLLLLDEPTSRLDPDARSRVLSTIATISERFGITVVMVTHDPIAAAAAGRTVTIRDGRVGAEGRKGAEYAVVGPDGSLQLPDHALAVLPPGSLVQVTAASDHVRLDQPGAAR